MKYDEQEIKVTYETIAGRKIPVYLVPVGMSSASKSKVLKDDDDYEQEEETEDMSLYDEENSFVIADEFINI